MADIVAVASTVYNMAGDEEGRLDFRKSQLIAGIVHPNSASIGQRIVESYRSSSALQIRSFLRWSQTDSDFLSDIGVTSGELPGGEDLDQGLIKDHTVAEPGYTVSELLSVDISRAEVSYWVAQYMARNHESETYSYTYVPGTNTVTVRLFSDDSTLDFNPVDYVQNDRYLYVQYRTTAGRVFWFIYHEGTGIPELDPLFDQVTPEYLGSFYPPIPFRYENAPVGPLSPNGDLAAIYPTCKRAFKRAFGVDFDDVQEKILDNDSIGDIDYVYAVLAASLNTKENSSKKYIYKFFEYLLANSDNYTEAEELAWIATYRESPMVPPPPWRGVKVESVRAGTSNYRTDIRWAFMHENTGTGLLKPGAKYDELWFEVMPDPLVHPTGYQFGFNQQVALCWQVTGDSWRRLTITGLQYNNFIYKMTSTRTTARQALETTDGDSEFLVPLHEVLFQDMPLVDAIQMGTSCSYLVFNCYETRKQKWYETDWFKVLLVVVILAVSIVAAIVTGGASLGVGGAAIGGLLAGSGLSAVVALIIAAAVEALAGLLIAFLITEVSVALFGEEWGPIIGAIVSFVFTFGISMGSINEMLTALTKPDVWISLATATGNATALYMQAQAQEIAEDTARMLQEYSDKNAEVQRMYNEMVSGGSSGIDLATINRYIRETSERPADFLKRTLATGSDIVEITLKQIEDFSRYNLQLVVP